MKTIWKMTLQRFITMSISQKIFSTKGQAEEYIKSLKADDYYKVYLTRLQETPNGEMIEDIKDQIYIDNSRK